MKLVFCPACHDVFRLWMGEERHCRCGASWGKYLGDDLTGKIGGQAIPLCIPNDSLREAVSHRPESGDGRPFAAFVIPRRCDTVKECRGQAGQDPGASGTA